MRGDLIDAWVQVKTAQRLAMEKHAEIPPEMDLAQQYAAALDWWRDAGVDQDFADGTQSWLAEPETAKHPVIAAEAKKTDSGPAPHVPAIDQTIDLETLEAFREWWMAPDSPLPSGPNPRVAPRGEVGAPLMLIAPMPELDDKETLMSGAQGRMLGNIARALGIDPERIYVASALPTHITLPDWDALHRDGLGHALAHHIALAKPERVLAFGSKLPMLLGHDATAPIESFNAVHGVPTLTTFAPDRLLDHPRQRARLWQRLLAWTS